MRWLFVFLTSCFFGSVCFFFFVFVNAVTESDISTLVEGVSVITGDFYLGEEDYVVAGVEPIPIRRYYLSAQGGIHEYPHLDGTLALSIDSLGIRTHFRYDALGHLIETRTEGAVETYTYEGDLLVKKVDREGLITTYTYDGAGRKILETADGERTQFTYDAMGNLAS